jgi:hypothetical protein
MPSGLDGELTFKPAIFGNAARDNPRARPFVRRPEPSAEDSATTDRLKEAG